MPQWKLPTDAADTLDPIRDFPPTTWGQTLLQLKRSSGAGRELPQNYCQISSGEYQFKSRLTTAAAHDDDNKEMQWI